MTELNLDPNDDELIKRALNFLMDARSSLPNSLAGNKIKLAISGVFYEHVPSYMIPPDVRPDFKHFNAGLVSSLMEGLE